MNLPTPRSIGPAIIKTAETAQQIAARRGIHQRTQEANLAAQAMTFERDGDGNLTAPKLPLGNNGLVAPNIYDTQYTAMVTQRYVQQMKIDMSEQLNEIATNNRFDPDAYRVVAEKYLSKVTEIAADNVKGDINVFGQQIMVGHFNYIVRELSEREHRASAKTHELENQRVSDLASQAAYSGLDADLIHSSILIVEANILDGIGFNYYDGADAAAKNINFEGRMALSFKMGEISRMPQGAETTAFAIEEFTRLAEGIGDLQVIRNGKITDVPIVELYPDFEIRTAMAEELIGAVFRRESSREGFESEQFNTQDDSYVGWYEPHIVSSLVNGTPIDVGTMFKWFQQAEADENLALQTKIRADLKAAYATTANKTGTAFEQIFARVLEDYADGFTRELNKWLKKTGQVDSDVSNEEMSNFKDAFDRFWGGLDLPQTTASAMVMDNFYSHTAGFVLNNDPNSMRNLPMSPEIRLERVEQYIDQSMMGRTGVIGLDFSSRMNPIFNNPDGNIEQTNRALDIARMMYERPALKKNMSSSTAFGRNGQALAYIFENYAPGRIHAGTAAPILKKFDDPGYSPHTAWKSLSDDERGDFREKMESALALRHFKALGRANAQGTEISMFNFSSRPELASVPAEMEHLVFNDMRSRAGFIDASNDDAFLWHIEQSVIAVAKQHGYVPSDIGYSQNKFPGIGADDVFPVQSTYAFSKFAPSAFARYKTAQGNRDFELEDAMREDFQLILNQFNDAQKGTGIRRLVAGVNAAVEYLPFQDAIDKETDQIIPSYRIVIINDDGTPAPLTSDMYIEGDRLAINFESTRARIYKTRKEGFITASDKRTLAEIERKKMAKELVLSP